MTKFPTRHALSIFSCLVEDAEEILELDQGTLSRDFLSLEKSSLSRGESVLLVSLPQICNDFERSLEIGWYKRRYTGVLSRLDGYLPVFLRSLYLRVFSEGGVLLEDPCVETIRIIRQLLRCFKKYEIDCPPEAKESSIDEFIAIESELPSPSLSWGSRDLRCDRGWPSLVDLVQRNLRRTTIRARLCEIDRNWSESEILRSATFAQGCSDSIISKFVFDFSSNPKHGPGAVSERYSISKFEFPTWNERLEKFFPYDVYGLINHNFMEESPEPDGFRSDVPAKLIAVRKDYSKPRLIASEPIGSQYIQQLILKNLRKNVGKSVLRHCIDFLDQQPSKDAVIKASQSSDGNSSIDLSSASDRLSCAVVECVFRGKYSFLELLNSARSPRVTIRDGQILDCKKFAAQGAAFTFPVQSIVYAILCMGVFQHLNPRIRLADAARSLRVYGDDIICPRSLNDGVLLLLTALDMVVNQSKSFSQGFFRESCGMDAYRGHDVTPAYVRTICFRRSPNETRSVVDCSNNLYLKGFIRASSKLLDLLPKEVRQDIPYVSVGSPIWGICGPNVWARKYRYNRKWQRYEARVLSLMDCSSSVSPDGELRLFQWLIEKPRQDRIYDPKKIIRSRVRFSVQWVDAALLRHSSTV